MSLSVRCIKIYISDKDCLCTLFVIFDEKLNEKFLSDFQIERKLLSQSLAREYCNYSI